MVKRIFIISVILAFSGCSRTIEYYEYSAKEIPIENNGVLNVGLLGEFSEDNTFLEKRAISGNPYSLSISFSPTSDLAFCINKLFFSQGEAVMEVNLLGDKCGKETTFKDFPPGTKIFSFEKINMELGKPVKITILSSMGSGDRNEINIELTNKYRVEEKNIFLSRVLGV